MASGCEQPAASNDAAPASTNIPVTPITSFLRFLYMGHQKNSIPYRRPIDIDTVDTELACIISLAAARPELPTSTIIKVYQAKLYTRVDDTLIALAYCARQMHNMELRVNAYRLASQLIDNQHDFLLFIHYCVKISENMHGPGKINFGHGLRRAVTRWYEKHDAVALANLFGEHRGWVSWTHRAVIRNAHHRTKKHAPITIDPHRSAASASVDSAPATTATSSTEAAVPPTAAAGSLSSTAVPSTEIAGQLLSTATSTTAMETSSTETATPSTSTATATPSTSTATVAPIDAPEPADAEPDDRKDVFHLIFCSNSLKYLEYLATKPELGPGAQRLKDLQILKTNEDLPSAIAAIRQHNFRLTQIPSHLLESVDVWEVMMPTMSYHELLHHFHTIRDFGFFNPNGRLVRVLIDAFSDRQRLIDEQICPIRIYITMRLYKKNVRYLSMKKAEFYSKKVAKRNLEYNAEVKNHLKMLFYRSLVDTKPTPAKFFITMDLREGNKRRAVLRNKHINCFKASFLLMYSIFVREKGVQVYTFGDTKNELKPVKEKLSRTNYKEAKQYCDSLKMAHTHQDLKDPLVEAAKKKKPIDVFITIVDSVARFNRHGEVPIEEFVAYKTKHNKFAKYIVVNLSRASADLKIPDNEQMAGFFEICGFHENIPKMINALARHCFT